MKNKLIIFFLTIMCGVGNYAECNVHSIEKQLEFIKIGYETLQGGDAERLLANALLKMSISHIESKINKSIESFPQKIADWTEHVEQLDERVYDSDSNCYKVDGNCWWNWSSEDLEARKDRITKKIEESAQEIETLKNLKLQLDEIKLLYWPSAA